MRQMLVDDLNTWTSGYYIGIEKLKETLKISMKKKIWSYEKIERKNDILIATILQSPLEWDCEVVDKRGRWVYAKIIDAYEDSLC